MLKRVLQAIIGREALSTSDLAKVVGVSPETLEDMMGLLLDRGLLAAEKCQPSDSVHCSGCTSSDRCDKAETSSKVYIVTEKGKRYAES